MEKSNINQRTKEYCENNKICPDSTPQKMRIVLVPPVTGYKSWAERDEMRAIQAQEFVDKLKKGEIMDGAIIIPEIK